MNKPSISLRSVLSASLAAVPSVASTRTAPGPDALLLDVLARYWRVERAILAMETAPEPLLTAPEYPAWESRFDRLIASRTLAIGQMADLRAVTAEGQQGKATVLERCLPPCLLWCDAGADIPEIRLALSLARDVAGGAA